MPRGSGILGRLARRFVRPKLAWELPVVPLGPRNKNERFRGLACPQDTPQGEPVHQGLINDQKSSLATPNERRINSNVR
jgi:hypothetical protein